MQDIKKVADFLDKTTFLNLTTDLSFKAYFVKNKELLKSLLTNFLPLPKGSSIVDIKLLNPELTPERQKNKTDASGKTFRFGHKGTNMKRKTPQGT